jgi:hypothetical protein
MEPHCAPALRAARKRPADASLFKEVQEGQGRGQLKGKRLETAPSAERKALTRRVIVEAKASTYLGKSKGN